MRTFGLLLLAMLAGCAIVEGVTVDDGTGDALLAARTPIAEQKATLARAQEAFARETSLGNRLRLATLLAALPIQPDRVPAAETEVFRLLNDTTVLPFVLLWPVMQLGNLLVVPASALLAAALRRWRLAAALLIGGFAAYWLVKVVKGVVTRPRPAGLLTTNRRILYSPPYPSV